MGVITINNNWSHDSDSLLEMTLIVSGPQMLMYGLNRPKQPPYRKGVPNDLPTEKEADIRAQIVLNPEPFDCVIEGVLLYPTVTAWLNHNNNS